VHLAHVVDPTRLLSCFLSLSPPVFLWLRREIWTLRDTLRPKEEAFRIGRRDAEAIRSPLSITFFSPLLLSLWHSFRIEKRGRESSVLPLNFSFQFLSHPSSDSLFSLMPFSSNNEIDFESRERRERKRKRFWCCHNRPVTFSQSEIDLTSLLTFTIYF